jgi:2-polyprenyl-3-methyl-5-hydroxy-6-metoxy-1,4-benzoquinol methylase
VSEKVARPGRPPRAWPDAASPNRELIDRLNAGWRVAGPDGPAGTLRQRLARPLRRALTFLLRPQETFNSAVVQQLNYLNELTDVTLARDVSLRAMVDDAFDHVDAAFEAFETVHARLDPAEDELRRHRESLAARDRRVEDAMTVIRTEHAELRTALGVVQHQMHHLAKAAAARPAAAAAGAATAAAAPMAPPSGSTDALSHKYVGFEDAFRGSPDAIRAGLAAYVPLFAGASDVLDVGCGRGEFLSLLREHGVGARGIDLNETMVEVCRRNGLEAEVADALAYLRAQPDGSVGGLFAAQVVEHLEPAYLTHLLDAAFEKLRPGAPIVLETINAACWFAFFESYLRDITHVRALHPDTLKFLLVASGFQQIDIRYSAPYPDHEKLQPVASGVPADAAETINANVEKMNRLLFTHLDYAAIARKS